MIYGISLNERSSTKELSGSRILLSGRKSQFKLRLGAMSDQARVGVGLHESVYRQRP